MKAPIKIELFGQLCITQGSRTVTRFRTYKTGVLLAYMAFYADRPHPREELIELLWPECDPVLGRNSLSQSLSSLRHQLEPPGTSIGEVLHADRYNVRLVPETFTTDVAKFEEAGAAFLDGQTEKDRAAAFVTLTQLYRGELLPGFYEDWNIREREKLKTFYLRVLVDRIGQLESQNDSSSAIECARLATEIDPLDESAHMRLIRLLAANENYAGAVKQYGVLHNTLQRELGVTPSSEAVEIATRLRAKVSATHADRDSEHSRASRTTNDRQQKTERAESAKHSGIWAVLAIDNGEHSSAAFGKLVARHGGTVERADADLCIVSFARGTDALECAIAVQRSHDKTKGDKPLPQMALHVGESGSGGARSSAESIDGVLDQSVTFLRTASPGQFLCSEAAAMLLLGNSDPGIRFQDLGSYRLAGKESSQRLYQIEYEGRDRSQFPPLKADPGNASTLPRHLSRFFGREDEITHLSRLCDPEAGDVRLITVTGPGGTGKTRLSLETARALEASYRNAVWFVPLADIAEPRFLPSAVLEAMGQPCATGTDPFKYLVKILPRDKALLVLDNFEHWLPDTAPAVAEESRSLVQKLLEQVSGLRCLVTSRKRLGLVGEREFFLEPLPVPKTEGDVEETNRCESVQLFLDRAQYVRPSFQITDSNASTIADICRKLEGIPLALELAAAKTQILTQTQILDGLSNRLDFLYDRRRQTEERHQKLRATIDWSFQMLAPETKEFFAKLSIFRGGANLSDVEEVCAEPMALDHLALLQDFSFVSIEETSGVLRFRVLETLREYGEEKLPAADREVLLRRHAEHYLQVAETASRELRSQEQSRWLQSLERDHQNFLSALDWCVESGSIETGLQIACALRQFWDTRGFARLGLERLTMLQRATTGAVARPIVARASLCAASLSTTTSDFAAARDFCEQGLNLFRELGDEAGEAQALSDLGRIAFEQGDYAVAHPAGVASAELARKLGDDHCVAASLNTIGLVACEQGRYDDAIKQYLESLDLRRKLGDQRGIAAELNNLGVVYRRKGDYTAAKSSFTESMEIQREVGNQRSVAGGLSNLGLVAEHERDYENARSLQAEALKIRREIGDDWGIARSFTILGLVSWHEGDLDDARKLLEESLSICRRMGNKLGIGQTLGQLGDLLIAVDPERSRPYLAESLELMLELNNKQGLTDVLQAYSRLAAAVGNLEQSARLFFVADEMRRTIGAKLPPFEQSEIDRQLELLKRELTAKLLSSAEKQGRKLTVDQAADLARTI